MFGPVECEDSGRVQFTHFPLEPEIISSIQPMGAMAGSHVTPVDHIYITHDRPDEPGHGYVVVMPAGGIVIEVGRMPNPDRPDYRIVIAHTCRIFTTFIHTGEPVAELKALIGELDLGANWYGAFPIDAGDVLADASTNTMDFMVHDQEVTLPGFIVPETYIGEPWKVHTVDPFDFYDEPLRSQVLAFNPRTAEPVGGKIDYDVDGRLVGNWFVEGTGGYGNGGNVGPGYVNYWDTHLAIAYHYIDPSTLIVSIGADTGIPKDACRVCAGAYGIKGNSPDPANIGVSDGMVKYELIGRIRLEPGAPAFNDEANSVGVFLAEMIDDRSVRIEVFPGVLPSAVQGFTDEAVVYTR
jgi:hypothetical protein